MQKWEYGYMWDVNAYMGDVGALKTFILVVDASGNRVLGGANYRLQGLNILGSQGWIITQGLYDGKQNDAGWMIDLIKQNESSVRWIYPQFHHFMRRPNDSDV